MTLIVDGPVTPATLWQAWTLAPTIVIPVVAGALIQLGGIARLWRHAGIGRGIRRWQAGCALAGWLTLALALLSPLHELGEALFSAHMAQHEVLMVIAAPLIILGAPQIACAWVLPATWRQPLHRAVSWGVPAAAWRLLDRPLTAWLLQAIAIWAWHIPSLYDAAVTNDALHALQHVSFLGTALLFWWVVLDRHQRRRVPGHAVVSLITTAAHTGALGALLTFAETPMYHVYQQTAVWGLSALEDQQLAGLLMWIPAGIVYLGATLASVAAWIGSAEQPVSWPSAAAV